MIAYESRAPTPAKNRYLQIEQEISYEAWNTFVFICVELPLTDGSQTPGKPPRNPKVVTIFPLRVSCSLNPKVCVRSTTQCRKQQPIGLSFKASSTTPEDAYSKWLSPGWVCQHCATAVHSKSLLDSGSCWTNKDRQTTTSTRDRELHSPSSARWLAATRTETLCSGNHRTRYDTRRSRFPRSIRFVFPLSLSKRAVQLARHGHHGIVKAKQLLRKNEWFPDMNTLAHMQIKSCLPCQADVHPTIQEPLAIIKPPSSPGKRYFIGFCSSFPDSKYTLVRVPDFYGTLWHKSSIQQVHVMCSPTSKLCLSSPTFHKT